MLESPMLQSPMLQSPRAPLSSVQPNLPGRAVTPSKPKAPPPSKAAPPSKLGTPSLLQSPMLQSPRVPLSSVQPNGRSVTPSKPKAPPSKLGTPSKMPTPSRLHPDSKSGAAVVIESGAAVVTLVASKLGVTPIALPAVPGYDVVSQLGRGGFGAVYLAYTPEGREVAVKVVYHGGRKSGAEERYAQFDAEEAEHEASIHRELSEETEVTKPHPSVVLLHELIAESTRSVLVFERVPGVDLARHAAAQPGGRLGEAAACDAVRHGDIVPPTIEYPSLKSTSYCRVPLTIGAAPWR